MPSKVGDGLMKDHPALLNLAIGLPLEGGVPIMHQGECVGGVAASGVQGHEDEQVARAGAAAVA